MDQDPLKQAANEAAKQKANTNLRYFPYATSNAKWTLALLLTLLAVLIFNPATAALIAMIFGSSDVVTFFVQTILFLILIRLIQF